MKIVSFKNLSISQRIMYLAVAISVMLVTIVLLFSANQIVASKNSIKASVNENRSFAVIEKIDRNFYERFGDVQAFAFNKLAQQAIDSGRASEDVQKFINTMISYYVLYDLMLIVNREGKIIAANTTDKNGKLMQTKTILGEDMSNEEWFRTCFSLAGPEGGAWYSDFMENKMVATLLNSRGYGMAFAAPIKNNAGEVIGAWYNYANWSDVTQDIRRETERRLKREEPNAFILITNKNGDVIDGSDENHILKLQLKETSLNEAENIDVNGIRASFHDYVCGIAEGSGAYTYKGNNWKVFTFVPKESLSVRIFFGELLPFASVVIAVLACGIIGFFLMARQISNTTFELQNIIKEVGEGGLPIVPDSHSTDELAQMKKSIKNLVESLRKTSAFANEVGNGNLEAVFTALSEHDILGQSLLTMRGNLVKIKVDEEKRKWIINGMAELGDKFRKSAGLYALCEDVLIFVCKYLNANQGAIFLHESQEGKNILKLVSCYAWNRKKFKNIVVEEDEGLIGQVWIEAQVIYITDVPDDFVKITSGLGESNPSCICILPLKTAAGVLGVMEIATFKKFESHEMELLTKISENLASALESERTAERTSKLLQQTQQQTELMRSQEEELRQSLEEMTSTQEEFARREKEYQQEIARFKDQARKINNGVPLVDQV
jgi:signal transduction histidine kinase